MTAGPRTTVTGTRRDTRVNHRSAASLLQPYRDTGAGGSLSSRGLPSVEGPAAAKDDRKTTTGGLDIPAQASARFRVPMALTRRYSRGWQTAVAPARW